MHILNVHRSCVRRFGHHLYVHVTLKMFSLLVADMSGVDWMVRHGRSLALAIAVKSAPERLCGKDYGDTVTETILASATADRVRPVFVDKMFDHVGNAYSAIKLPAVELFVNFAQCSLSL